MKFSKKMTKFFAMTAMSAMLLTMTASASTVKTPNMGGVSTQYSAMVQAANNFDPSLGNLIVNALSNACYTTAAIDTAIANTNNAITAINNITLVGENNSGTSDTVFMRDVAGSVSTAVSYLNNAGLTGAVAFTLEKANFKSGSSEYYQNLNFKVVTNLYTANAAKDLITLNTAGKAILNTEKRTEIINQLNRYKDLLSAVKTFDQAAGCYDTDNTTSNTTSGNTTNTTQAPIDGDIFIEAEDITINVGDDFDIMEGVYAEDSNGNDITDQVTTSGEVNTAVPGEYEITYSVNGVKEIIIVTVVATTSDAIIDASNVTISVGDSFDPLDYADAIDDAGEGANISDSLTYKGYVNTSKEGDYTITYSVIGENGNKVVREITVTVEKATSNAVIDAEDTTIMVGENFDPMDIVSATDEGGKGDDLTNEVEVDGDVDTSKAGTYTLTYSVTGENGVEVTKTVKVTVVKEIKDAVILAYDRTIDLGSDFDKMKDVKAMDNNGGGKDITGDVEVDGYVDTNVEGDYEVTYSVIGANGIKVSKTVTISVLGDWVDPVDPTDPVDPVDTTDSVDTTSTPGCTIPGCTIPNCTLHCTYPGCTIPNCTLHCTVPGCTVLNCTLHCDTTCAPVNTTCAPVNTTCYPVNTTCAPVNTTCTVVAPTTTCLPVCVGLNICFEEVEVEENCTQEPECEEVVEVEECDPIRIVVDPIKVEIVNQTEIVIDDTVVVPDNTVVADDNVMKPTGTNIVELVFSGLSLLGTAFVVKKRR